MKITAVINNYPDTDTASAPGIGPVWTMLPDSCVIRSGNPFFIPDLSHRYEALPALVLRGDKLGKSVEPRFACRYLTEATAAFLFCDFTLLDSLRAASLPWVMALGYDRSLVTGRWIQEPATHGTSYSIQTRINGTPGPQWSSDLLVTGIGEVLSAVSRDNTLKTGDLLLPALPGHGIRLTPGMNLSASLNGEPVLELKIK